MRQKRKRLQCGVQNTGYFFDSDEPTIENVVIILSVLRSATDHDWTKSGSNTPEIGYKCI